MSHLKIWLGIFVVCKDVHICVIICTSMCVSTHRSQRLMSIILHHIYWGRVFCRTQGWLVQLVKHPACWTDSLSLLFLCWDCWELSAIYLGARDLNHSPQASLESFLSTEPYIPPPISETSKGKLNLSFFCRILFHFLLEKPALPCQHGSSSTVPPGLRSCLKQNIHLTPTFSNFSLFLSLQL